MGSDFLGTAFFVRHNICFNNMFVLAKNCNNITNLLIIIFCFFLNSTCISTNNVLNNHLFKQTLCRKSILSNKKEVPDLFSVVLFFHQKNLPSLDYFHPLVDLVISNILEFVSMYVCDRETHVCEEISWQASLFSPLFFVQLLFFSSLLHCPCSFLVHQNKSFFVQCQLTSLFSLFLCSKMDFIVSAYYQFS